jgi:hypothetical protein
MELKMYFDTLSGVIATIIGFALFGLGWAFSASTIANECQKLNAFYVSEKVFECKVKNGN